MELEIECKKINNDENIVGELQRSNKPILIYGCANHAELVWEYLDAHDLKTEAFIVDSLYFNENQYIKSIPVKNIQDYLPKIGQYNIVLGFCDVDKSKFILNNMPLLKCQFYLLWEPYEAYEWNEEYITNNLDAFREVYRNLADTRSKRILNELINAKLNVSGKKILELADSKQYFNELTFCADSEEEIFVDCGAFNGDTILKYVSFTDGIYRKIYAFEPNDENVMKLRENTKYLSGIEIINKGTWRKEGELEFEENGSDSQIVQEGKVKIPVITIDEAVKEEKVTFIKMDVEGSELESLEGAEKTIRRNMPKLAICCYHKRDDIVNLFHYIKRFSNETIEYRFYLRHHSNSVYETVLYAVPVKRYMDN